MYVGRTQTDRDVVEIEAIRLEKIEDLIHAVLIIIILLSSTVDFTAFLIDQSTTTPSQNSK